jgi:GNAT superfamily N-acetyltransferase
MRIRVLAYAGPTNTLIHNGRVPVSEFSIMGVANERKKEIGRPNEFHFKIVDTDLPPAPDDPEGNGGRTIAIATWSAHNLNLDRDAQRIVDAEKENTEGSDEPTSNLAPTNPDAAAEEEKPFLPPELNLTILSSLLDPLREGQREIMGPKPYLKLNTLSTHPEHERRGAGSMLVEWGVEVADQLGLETYLNTSVRGRPLYERFGFKLVRETLWDRTRWGGEGVDWHGHMVRKSEARHS